MTVLIALMDFSELKAELERLKVRLYGEYLWGPDEMRNWAQALDAIIEALEEYRPEEE